MLICDACGGEGFEVECSRGRALVLRCSTCRAEVTVEGASVTDAAGEVWAADATPPKLAAIGTHPDDPWIWLPLRVQHSQREQIQRAARYVREVHGIPDGPLTMGRALELICADFLAGAHFEG